MIWLKLQRFEIVALSSAIGVWVAAGIFIAWRLDGFAAEFPACFGLASTSEPYCRAASLQFAGYDQAGEALLWLTLGIPLFTGVALGAPVVARELEAHTAQLAWSFSLSRVEWLRRRLLPIAIAALLLLVIVSIAAEVLAVARLGGDDPGFQRYDQRGVLVVVRGTLALTAALLTGAWLGRTLPAILLALALSALIVFGLVMLLDIWRRTDAILVERDTPNADQILATALILEPAAVLPDGTVVVDRNAELPDRVSFDALRVIPNDQYWLWIGREAGALGVLTALGSVGTVAVVVRRRPV